MLAFSGGIDSCHAARLLSSQGYSVTALTMDMTGDNGLVSYARKKAGELGIEFIAEDCRDIFRKNVTDYFVSEYISGRTPAPCTICNYAVKWKVLYEKALAMGAGYIATGHYFNIIHDNGYFYVSKGSDPVKDQSYYLWMLPQEILSRTLTPMGNVIKSEVKRSLPDGNTDKESMGICFLKGRPYRDFILGHTGRQTAIPVSVCPGDITDTKGNVIGSHDGAAFYTIGQKKGLTLPAGHSVTGIDTANNKVITGPTESLYRHTLTATGCMFVNPEDLDRDNISVVIRGIGRNPEGGCSVRYDGRTMTINLGNPAWAPAPGQPVVLYDGDRVLGGGILSGAY